MFSFSSGSTSVVTVSVNDKISLGAPKQRDEVGYNNNNNPSAVTTVNFQVEEQDDEEQSAPEEELSDEPVSTEHLGREKWHIFVLGYKRYKSLNRLLRSLRDAEYEGERVALHICIDGGSGSDWEKSVEVAKKFNWKYGSKELRISEKNHGLAQSWLTSWVPASDDEHAIILEDDLTVSPLFFKFLKINWAKYGDRPEIAALTLQRQRLVATNANYRTIKTYNRPFAYQLLGSWGFSPSPVHWREFLKLDFAKLDPSVPGLVTTKWFNRQRRGKMWTQYFIYYCWKNNLYNLYQTCPNRKTLATNWRERGVHYGKSKGPDFKILERDEWNEAWDNPPDVIDLYNFGLKKVGESKPMKDRAGHVDKQTTPSGPATDDEEDNFVALPVSEMPEDESDSNDDQQQEEEVSTQEITKTEPESESESTLPTLSGNSKSVANDLNLTEQDLKDLESTASVDLGTESGTELDTSALVEKARLVVKDNIMFLQLLNAGFVEMTKAWVCNVQHMPRVLDRTLFVCTDQAAYDQMLEFVRTSGIELHLHLQIHKAPKQLRYGQLSYYQFILYRSSLLISLLKNDIPLFLIESDATWFGDPVKYLLEQGTDDLDIILMHNDYRKSKNMNGGFIWFKNTKSSLGVVRKLYGAFKVKLGRLARAGEKNVGGAGNEQQYFQALIFRPKVNAAAANINARLLQVDKFAPGLWYNKRYVKEGLAPLIVLNNWIRGNDAKKVRAKQWGTWFLDDKGETCIDTRAKSAADVALNKEWSLGQLEQLAQRAKREISGLESVVTIQFVDSRNIELTRNSVCNLKTTSPAMLESTVFICTDDEAHSELQKFAQSSGLALQIYHETRYSSKKSTYFRASVVHRLLSVDISVILYRSNVALNKDPAEYLKKLSPDIDIATSDMGKRVTSAQVSLFKTTPSTRKFMEKYVVGAQKAMIMTGKSTVDETKLIKSLNVSPLKVQTISKDKPFPLTNAKSPFAVWEYSSSDSSSKITNAKSAKFYLLNKDSMSCKV